MQQFALVTLICTHLHWLVSDMKQFTADADSGTSTNITVLECSVFCVFAGVVICNNLSLFSNGDMRIETNGLFSHDNLFNLPSSYANVSPPQLCRVPSVCQGHPMAAHRAYRRERPRQAPLVLGRMTASW